MRTTGRTQNYASLPQNAQIGARYGRALWPSLAPDALEVDVGVERVSKEEVVHSRARAAQDLVVETELYER